MTERTNTRIRRFRPAVVLAGIGLLGATMTACGNAKAGTALPDGDDAAAYVSAKFADKLKSLSDDFTGNEPRKSTLTRFARVDDKKSNSTISAVQVGHPPARLSKNHSNTDSGEYLDVFHPAKYTRLGPVYKSLAPTEWVSEPYTAGSLSECYWGGAQDVCKMLQAVADSVDKGKAAKKANSKPDGSVELSAEVTLDNFLKNRVIVFPDSLLGRITPTMKQGVLPTRIVLDPHGKLTEIDMNGKIAGDGHEVEINMQYELDGQPSENDLPKVPDPSQVTVLADQAAVQAFYDRMGQIQNR